MTQGFKANPGLKLANAFSVMRSLAHHLARIPVVTKTENQTVPFVDCFKTVSAILTLTAKYE